MALEFIATSQLWTGEPINAVKYPLSIGELWTEQDLAAIGLQVRVPAPPPPLNIEAIKAAKVASAWEEYTRRFAESVVSVVVNGQLRSYGCDPSTRENIVAIVGLIVAAPQLVANPRAFTPKGDLQPVDTTHAEFLAIYAAGLAKGDAFFTAYAAHKSAVMTMTTIADVRGYDVTEYWPV